MTAPRSAEDPDEWVDISEPIERSADQRSCAGTGLALVGTVLVAWLFRATQQVDDAVVARAQPDDARESSPVGVALAIHDSVGLTFGLLAAVVAVVLLVRVAQPEREFTTALLGLGLGIAIQVPNHLLGRALDGPETWSPVPMVVSLAMVGLLGAVIWMVARAVPARAIAVGTAIGGVLTLLVGLMLVAVSSNSAIPTLPGPTAIEVVWMPVAVAVLALVTVQIATGHQRERERRARAEESA